MYNKLIPDYTILFWFYESLAIFSAIVDFCCMCQTFHHILNICLKIFIFVFQIYLIKKLILLCFYFIFVTAYSLKCFTCKMRKIIDSFLDNIICSKNKIIHATLFTKLDNFFMIILFVSHCLHWISDKEKRSEQTKFLSF